MASSAGQRNFWHRYITAQGRPARAGFYEVAREGKRQAPKGLAALGARLVSAENRLAALKRTGADPIDPLTSEQTRARIAQMQDELGVGGLAPGLEKQLAELEKKL